MARRREATPFAADPSAQVTRRGARPQLAGRASVHALTREGIVPAAENCWAAVKYSRA
jgi:hypothetical protein